MRVVFVSGVAVGGAARSTLELAEHLSKRDHDVAVLLTNRPGPSSLFGWCERLAIKTRRTPLLGATAAAIVRRPGRKMRAIRRDSIEQWEARVAENALGELLQRTQPDVAIVNSVPRRALRVMLDELRVAGIRSVLYIREAHAVTHLSVSRAQPDLVVSNAREYCDDAHSLGVDALFVPSVVDLSASMTPTSRRSVVLVNPAPENNPELVLRLADARPNDHFVLQESWPLKPSALADLRALVDSRTNVELRRRTDRPAEVYQDARILLATYPSGRPRVILEAQANGIPIVAFDRPALAEVAGPAGFFVDVLADDQAWIDALDHLDDPDTYATAVNASQAHARRDEVQPDHIVEQLETALRRLIED